MSNATLHIPSYRNHKASGQAVVTIDGRDIYLGKFKSAVSRSEYNRIIAEWTAHGGTLLQSLANDLTVTELAAAFLRHARTYYRRPDGTPTNEIKNVRLAIRRLTELYGRTRAADFGPLALKAVREQMIEANLACRTINQHVNRVRHILQVGRREATRRAEHPARLTSGRWAPCRPQQRQGDGAHQAGP